MGTTKSQNRKRLSWALAFLVSGLLYAPLVALAQTTEATAPADDDDETPVCPGRPLAVHPTEQDVKNTGLSFEVLCIIADTGLDRRNVPGPSESPDLLRRYLLQGPYEVQKLSGAEYRAVMEEAVRLWPQSQYSHAGLARVLLGNNVQLDIKPTPADKRQAAAELLTAAEIAFKQGKTPDDLDYGVVLPPLLAELGDKAALDRYYERVFAILPEGEGRYRSYLDYAEALNTLDDERAETYFRKATKVSPKGVGEAYSAYASYLLNHHKAQIVLELLVPLSQADRVLSKSDFHSLRCQALEQVGQKAEAALECQQAHDLAPPILEMPAPGGRPGGKPSACGSQTPAEPGLLARLLGVGIAYAGAYLNPDEDCRQNQLQTPPKCTRHPDDPNGQCYYDFVWNLAELITIEAGGELYGSQADVAWTVRDRVNRESTPQCGVFPGVNEGCAYDCPDPNFCDLQKKYCCVVRSFATYQPKAVSKDTLYLAFAVVDSLTPEPTSGFIPTGTLGCYGSPNACDNSLNCTYLLGNHYEYAPEGPNYFYANSATSYICQGFQPLIAPNCNVVAKETCGNSVDSPPTPGNPHGADNCYGRATRNQNWDAGPNFSNGPGVTTSGNTKQLPVGTYIYRDDQFKNPGGKQVVVNARLQTAGQANLRVLLKDSAFNEFGSSAK